MTRPAASGSLELSALDGTNPLAFLAALGTLVTIDGHTTGARLRWSFTVTWMPVIDGAPTSDPREFSEIVAAGLRGRPVSDEEEQRRTEAERAFTEANRAVGAATDAVRQRGLRGDERREVIEAEVRPLELDRDQKRIEWLRALSRAIPRPELALGKRIDCTPNEYREHATALVSAADGAAREHVDLLASFGSDAAERSGRIAATPFCFVTGSGHQYFLDTVRQLIGFASAERVYEALFKPWRYPDEKLSLRWDPIEARRYALMDRDPTASGNEARTVWMANLLAYRSLALFPSAPSARRLETTAWAQLADGPTFTWPIWEMPADPESIRSLLQIPELVVERPDPHVLRARGISAVFRASRIRIPPTGSNYKVNFSQARAVLAASADNRPR